jgi:hypothetical protein
VIAADSALGSGKPSGPVHWPSVLPEDAKSAWTDLREWVKQLVDRYALDARTVPPCWFLHNGHVEALVALRDAERACFGPGAPATGGMDWFRALWEIEHRLIGWSARTQCSAHEHRPNPHRARQVDDMEWERFVAADVAARAHRDVEEESTRT